MWRSTGDASTERPISTTICRLSSTVSWHSDRSLRMLLRHCERDWKLWRLARWLMTATRQRQGRSDGRSYLRRKSLHRACDSPRQMLSEYSGSNLLLNQKPDDYLSSNDN